MITGWTLEEAKRFLSGRPVIKVPKNKTVSDKHLLSEDNTQTDIKHLVDRINEMEQELVSLKQMVQKLTLMDEKFTIRDNKLFFTNGVIETQIS